MSKWRSLGRLGKNGEDAPEPQENSFLLNHPVCACPISYCWSRNVIQYLSEYVLRITKIERISESEMVGLKFSEQGKCSKPNLPRLRDLGGLTTVTLGWAPGVRSWLTPASTQHPGLQHLWVGREARTRTHCSPKSRKVQFSGTGHGNLHYFSVILVTFTEPLFCLPSKEKIFC